MMPKILIIRFSSIGDIVLASPVFRCLKLQLPGCELHFVTKKNFSAVTVHNPYIDRFFYYDQNMVLLLQSLQEQEYDYVIDLHANFRSIKICRALKKKTYRIRKLSIEKFLLTQFNINMMPKRHITLRSLDTVAALGVKDDGLGLDYFITEEEKIKEKDIPHAHLAGYIALVIGASYATKKLPVSKLRELCSKINHPIILIGGKEDASAGNQVAAVDDVKIYNACGKFSLNESADLVRRARLVISHDTGLQYIACAFKKPLLAIWGATSPALQVEPYYGSSFVTSHPIYENILTGISCQPCSKYGTDTCPLEHFNCMYKQDIDTIIKKIETKLAQTPNNGWIA